MNIETLECDKKDTEVIIQKLHETTDYIEQLKSDETNNIIKLKLRGFILELEKEIEWNEMILQELNESIDFENTKAGE